MSFLLRNGDRVLSGIRFPFLQWFCERTEQPLVGWDNANMVVRARGARPLAVLLYNEFWKPNIRLHIAAEGQWCTPDFLYWIFAYPFVELGCGRVTGLIARTNTRLRKLVLHLGFVEEGVLRESLPTGDDLIAYGMLRRECRWIGELNVEARRARTA